MMTLPRGQMHVSVFCSAFSVFGKSGIADRSVHLKCRIKRSKQSCVTEWLEQALYGARFE
jgi:hypothetical protein